MKTGSLVALLLVAGLAVAAEPAPPATSASADDATQPAARTPAVSPRDLAARLERGDRELVVLDVRSPGEFAAGHVPGAINVPHDEVPRKLAELAAYEDKDVVLYCRSGRRSALAAQSLREAGFTRLRQLEGDYPAWQSMKAAKSARESTDQAD